MNEFKEAKQAYENTPIPAELDQRVRAGIRQGKAKRARRAWGKRLGTVAACFVVVVGALNVSPTMASAAADIPVLGGLFQVLTIRSYETEKDQVHYQVEVPEVDSSADIAQRVNTEIQQRVDEHVAEMEKMWTEYHEAFIATGGTEEEWAQRSMDVNVTYDIKSQTDTTVSFVVDLQRFPNPVLLQSGSGERQGYYPAGPAGRRLGEHLQHCHPGADRRQRGRGWRHLLLLSGRGWLHHGG